MKRNPRSNDRHDSAARDVDHDPRPGRVVMRRAGSFLAGARRARSRRGAMLLEVLLSLSILLITIAVCGAALRNSMLWAERGDRVARSQLLAEDLLGRWDMGLLIPLQEMDNATERELTGTFGDAGPEGLGWRLKIVPDQNEQQLLRMKLTIVDGDPAGPEDTQQTLVTLDTIRALPQAINLKNDFGMTDEQIKMLTDALPGGTQTLDPEKFDPTSLARMDMEQLTQLLPLLTAAMAGAQGGAGIDAGDLGDLESMGQTAQTGSTGGTGSFAGGSSNRPGGGRTGAGASQGSGTTSGRRPAGGTRGGGS